MKDEIKEMKFEYRNLFNHINNCALSNKNFDISLTKHECKLIIRYFRKLTKENENLKDYKSRIEKAIEYIELWHYRNDYSVNSFTIECKNDLLNILQGVGKDE